jgi:hypothetical protein
VEQEQPLESSGDNLLKLSLQWFRNLRYFQNPIMVATETLLFHSTRVPAIAIPIAMYLRFFEPVPRVVAVLKALFAIAYSLIERTLEAFIHSINGYVLSVPFTISLLQSGTLVFTY